MPNFLGLVKPSRRGLRQISLHGNFPGEMPKKSDKPKLYPDIAERLRWHRDLLGVDQEELVRPLKGVKRSAYGNWETGTSRLSLDGALELRRVYKLSLDFMYEGIADALPMTLRMAWMERPAVSNAK